MKVDGPRVVFISGPLTGGDGYDANLAIALDHAQKVADSGAVPFIPHLYVAWDKRHPAEYEVWMSRCFAMLSRCDAIYRIPGDSPGADREVSFAASLGIPLHELTEEET